MTILEKIRHNVQKNGNKPAYSVENGGGGQSITWQELGDLSGRLAASLHKNLKSENPIIVYGHKDPYMLVCFLACVKAGRAYCPIDTSVPLNRVEMIIEEVEPEIVLSTELLPIEFEKILLKEEILNLIKSQKEVIDTSNYVSSNEVFYIIFTSGSTGKPKGVQITRECLDNFIQWGITLGGLKEGNDYVFLNQAPFSFDLSVMDLYLCLYLGGTLCALTKKAQQDMRLLLPVLERFLANVWVSTPSFADVCLSDKKFSETLLPNLTTFLFCGETLTNKTVERLFGRFPKANIINLYGPTESTVAVTDIVVTPEMNRQLSPLPVGKEKPGTWIQIVDDEGNVLPDGKKGEIIIIGNTVSIGYWKNEELNQKVFGKCKIDGKTYRFYRTGDEGYKKDGLLYYCGRLDLQIKLHGYRIEVEDIENNIMKLPGIKQVAVIPKYRGGKISSLAGFLVLPAGTEDEFLAAQRIREQLKEYLPDYMIPKKIKFFEQLPMTNNGKVDRRGLGGLL